MPIANRLGDPNAPVIVLVHCAPGDSQVFCDLAPRLSEHGHVVLVDLPDAGGSADSDSIDPDAAAEDVRAIVAGVDRPVTLVGASFGGWVCARVASREPPSNLRKLVALAGLAGLAGPHADAYNQMAGDLDADRMPLSALWDALISQSFPASALRERELARSMVGSISKARAARTLRRSAMVADASYVIDRYDVPAVILHGRHDVVLPLAYGEGLAAAGTAARLQVIETDAHLLSLTHVDDCMAAILA